MAGNYTRGAAYERTVQHILEASGWVASRHPLSRGAADIDAYRDDVHLMVQVKGGKPGRTMCPKDWNRLFELAERCGAVPVLANKTKGNRWAFHRLVGPKDGSGGRQPMVQMDLDGGFDERKEVVGGGALVHEGELEDHG